MLVLFISACLLKDSILRSLFHIIKNSKHLKKKKKKSSCQSEDFLLR